jgi:hypothetical protein
VILRTAGVASVSVAYILGKGTIMDLETYLDSMEERYDAEHCMIGRVWKGPGYHTRVPDGEWVHETNGAFAYALLLLREGSTERVNRATDVIRKVLTLQDTDSTSVTYGIWSWLLEEPLSAMDPPDWNWADFCGAQLAEIIVNHADVLPNDLINEIRSSLGHAAWAIFRRNVGPNYTNIAVLGGGVAAVAGEILSEPRLVEYGLRRLRNIVTYTNEHGGFNEYNSPTYTTVVIRECERFLRISTNEEVLDSARTIWRLGWETIADHYHPGTCQWAGPHSRGYANHLSESFTLRLSMETGADVPAHPSVEHEASGFVVPGGIMPCPEDLRSRFHALPKEEVESHQRFIKRSTDESSTWGTTWMDRNACLGSVNHDNFWTQRRPLIGYWRTLDDPAVVLRLRFLHDGKDFASAYVRTDQKADRTLSCVTFLSDKGDYHDHLDHPEDGIFHAKDFRLRCELMGEGARVTDLRNNLNTLSAGEYTCAVHTLPSMFDGNAVIWEFREIEGGVAVEAVCYQGSLRAFDFGALDPSFIALGLELLRETEAPSATSPVITPIGDTANKVTWVVGNNVLEVQGSVIPEEYV